LPFTGGFIRTLKGRWINDRDGALGKSGAGKKGEKTDLGQNDPHKVKAGKVDKTGKERRSSFTRRSRKWRRGTYSRATRTKEAIEKEGKR